VDNPDAKSYNISIAIISLLLLSYMGMAFAKDRSYTILSIDMVSF
jgi:hypothetical protein